MLEYLKMNLRAWLRIKCAKWNPPREAVDFRAYFPETASSVRWFPNPMAPESSGFVYALIHAPRGRMDYGRVRLVIRRCHINRKTGKWSIKERHLWQTDFYYRLAPLDMLQKVNDRKSARVVDLAIRNHTSLWGLLENIRVADRMGRPPGVRPEEFFHFTHEERVLKGWVRG
jgi:hypothetical protein